MKYALLLMLTLLLGCDQNQDAITQKTLAATVVERYAIAPWKHNAKGAYSIIFDDYCMDEARGIQDHASPEAEKRGLVFGFGVVTSLCSAHEWQRAREMISAGHEAVNHSHTHRCAVLQEPWCVDVWTDEEVGQEIDLSTSLIAEHTGVEPQFFIFPYDLYTPAKLQHLKQQGYAGARAGNKQALSSADFEDPFALNFDVKFPPEGLASQGFELNEDVDEAIARGQLAFRAFHGVADESWGTLTLDELRGHFDYLQAKQQAQELWVATITEIIDYNRARRGCQLTAGDDDFGSWLRLDGEEGSCPADVVLSVLLPLNSVELRDAEGVRVQPINGSYPLHTGREYRLAVSES